MNNNESYIYPGKWRYDKMKKQKSIGYQELINECTIIVNWSDIIPKKHMKFINSTQPYYAKVFNINGEVKKIIIFMKKKSLLKRVLRRK